MAARKVHLAEFMCGKGQRRLAGLKLAVGAAFMKELALQAKGRSEERERGRDIGHVDDGVAELQDEFLWKKRGGQTFNSRRGAPLA